MYSLPQSYNQTSKCKRCISSNAYEKAKEVAKMLTDLSTNVGDADTLTNQYIANKSNLSKIVYIMI